jgi:hypothetical protein
LKSEEVLFGLIVRPHNYKPPRNRRLIGERLSIPEAAIQATHIRTGYTAF